MEKKKSPKGRPRMRTGGSIRGTTCVYGDYGLRMKDHDRRVSAAQLKIGEETIKKRLRGMKFRLYTRVVANVGVYTSGNEQRMGKGKGSFDYWASRIGVSRIIFELKGEVHEQVVRDAFRLAGNKMPGMCLNAWGFSFTCRLTANRPVRVCEERRSSSHGHHEAGEWTYARRFGQTSETTAI